jgi:hypothetical protein
VKRGWRAGVAQLARALRTIFRGALRRRAVMRRGEGCWGSRIRELEGASLILGSVLGPAVTEMQSVLKILLSTAALAMPVLDVQA